MATAQLALISGKKRRENTAPKDRVAMGEVVLRRRNEGWTMPMAARELKISVATAYRYMDLALAIRIPPTVDKFRAQQNDRLDQTQRELQTQIDAANSLARKAYEDENVALMLEALKARDRALALQLRLDERRAKLNGLDAPIRVDAHITEEDAAETELAAMVREAKAKAAAEQAGAGQ